jgi:hypothetical protein
MTSQSSATTWALFKEQVDDTIIKALQPKIIYPLLFKTYAANGPVMEFNVTDSWLNPSTVSESGEYSNGVMNFTRKYATMKDVGIAPQLPVNWIKDARWDLVNDYVEAIGFGIARSINSDCLTAVGVFVAGGTYEGQTWNAVNTTYGASTNHSVAATATWASTTADVVTDISKTLGALEGDDAGDGRKYLIVNPSAFQYVRTDPNLLKYINYGDASLIQKGIYPTPFGVDFLSTSQASTTTALMVNTDLAALKYYEREPLTTEIDKVPTSKRISIVAYLRYALTAGRPKGLAVITGVA